jgi:HlyD family secretion protein
MRTSPVVRWAAAVTLGSALIWTACSSSEPAEPNEVVPVQSGTIAERVTSDALVFPIQQAAMVPKIAAPVKKVYVNRGDRVRAGQLLIELENQDLMAAVTESRAAYEQAEAAYETAVGSTLPEEVQKAELDVRAAKGAMDAQQMFFDGRQALFKQGAIAQKDVNDAQVALVQAKNQYEIAQKRLDDLRGGANAQAIKAAGAQRDAAKGRYDNALAQLSYSKITSPIDGVVTDRPVYAGEMPPSGMPIITVMDIARVIAKAHIPPAQAMELKVGDEAHLLSPGHGPVAGKVSLVSPALDPGGTTVEVWVEAANPDGVLRPGTSVQSQMIARTVTDALVIPEPAVVTGESGATSVIAVDAQNKPQKAAVTLGIRDDGRVQVTDGLKAGQRVVTTGAFELANLDPDVLAKTKVQIQAANNEADEK